MPTIQTVVVYSGPSLFEGTNLSVARGTTKPFEYIGAPYIDSFLWSDRLNAMNLEGVYFRPIYFTPSTSTHANTQCGGVQVHVTNRDTFDAVKVAFAMYYTIRELYPNDFSFTSTFKLLTGCSYVYDMTYSLEDLYKIVDEDVNNFKQIRAKYLIY